MTAFVVSSGQTSSGIILNSGDTLSVLSGGVTSNTLVHSGGTEIVFSGGLDHSAVLSGGTLDIFGGAVVSGATVASGGTLVLDNGAVASSTDGGATLHVLSGGTSVGTIVNSGGTIDVTGASATLVFAGDVTFDNATIDLGNASGATVQADGVLTFGSNAVVTHTAGTGVLTDDGLGGRAIINSGVISAVAPSGTLDITPETFTNSGTITVRNGDHVFIQPYGGADAFTNFNNGQLTGGTYDIGSGSILELGLNQFVTTLDATLTLGGSGAKLEAFNGVSQVQIDQSLSTIGAGGALHIQGDAAGDFGNLTIDGTLQVQDDAVVNFGDLIDAGTLELGGGTSVNSIAIEGTRAITLDPTSGHQVVVAGTISDEVGTGAGPGVGSVIATGGGYVELDGVGNSFTGGVTVTGSGTTLAISDDANLGNGGTLALGSGTALELFFGAAPAYTITHTITVAGDAIFKLDHGVTATFAGVITDGASPGTVKLTGDPLGAGTLVLANSNTYTGGTIIGSGTLEIEAMHGAGTGGITFAPLADPTLRIDAAAFSSNTTFANVISGFAPGDDIDLAGVPFTAGETLSIDANNLLTVSEGGDFYSLQMAAADTFSGDIFYLAGDGSGTTDIIATSSLSAGAGQTVQAPIVFNGATLTVLSGGTTIDTVINRGLLDVDAGGIVSGAVTFHGSGGTYEIDGTTIPGGTVAGFVSGDVFDLRGVAFDSGGGHVDLTSGNVLVVTENGSGYDINLDPGQDFTGDFFHLAADGSGGTLVTEDTTPCYCPGTLILTPEGEVPVEDLRIGDRVCTLSGEARVIEWIGRRSYSGQFVLGRDDILPVCIKAGALDDGIPHRDLWVSPNHAMYLEGVLIEAKDLVNGASVYQAETVEAVEYFHLELASHDVIFAEGAAAESFIEDDNRGLFHNAAEYWAMHPEPAAGPAQYWAPRCEEGFEVERARARIAARAGLAAPVETAPIGALRGHIDQIGPRITGWALDEACAEAPLCLDIYAGNELLGQVVANRYCAECAWIGDGRHGFELVPPEGLAFAPGSVTVRRSRDGAVLGPSSALAQWLTRAQPRAGIRARR